jgi:hypothetical protein
VPSVTLPPGRRRRIRVACGRQAGRFLSASPPWETTEKGLYVDYQPQGKRLSVTGTPTFFVNGRPLIRAQPLDAFARVIDDEVARASSPRSQSR